MMSAMISAPMTARPVAPVAPRPQRSSLVVRASGSRQEDKAKYVAKQDANEARNPGGSAGGANTRDKKNPTDAYGSSAIGGKEQGETQVQDSDHGQDALDKVKDALGNLTGNTK